MSARATLHAMGRIAAVPLQRRRNQGSMGSLWFTIGFALFVPVLLLFGGFWAHELIFAGGVGLLAVGCLLLMGAWTLLLTSLHEQVAFASARLLPGQVRLLRMTMAAAVAVCCVAVTAGFGILFGWLLLPAVATLVVLTGIAVLMRWTWLFVLLLVGNFALQQVRLPRSVEAIEWGTLLMQHRLAVAAVVVVACCAILWRLTPAPTPMRAGPRDGLPRDEPPGTPARKAQVDTAPIVALPSDAMTRALCVLPLAIDWRLTLRRIARRWLWVLVAMAIASRTSLARYADIAVPVLAGLMVLRFVDEAMAARQVLEATRREQQFFVLMPGWPRGAALGRALALRLSASHVASLAGAAVALASMLALRASTGAASVWWSTPWSLAALVAACLTLAIPLWAGWARARPNTGLRYIVPVAAPFLLWVLALGAGAWELVPTPAMCALYVVATAAWCGWRWHRMDVEPTPLPFGRLA